MIPAKKVCILTSVHQPFDSRVFHREAGSLVEGGYEVSLVAPHTMNEVVDGVRVIRIARSSRRILRWLRGWRIFSLALRERAELYHFHDPELLLVGILLRFFTKAKVIYDVHEHYPNAIKSKEWIPRPLRPAIAGLFSFLENLLIPVLDGVVFTTPIVGKRYTKRARRAVRLENYPLQRNFRMPAHDERTGIIYSGGIHPHRGIEVLLGAVSELRDDHEPEVTLMGNFSSNQYRAHIVNFITKHELNGAVRVKPPVPYTSLGKELSKHLVGVVLYEPTPNNMSCLPNKIFEYMASGTAVVASDFPLYRDIVQSARCGVVVNPARPEKVAKALEYLLNNPDKAKEMGENGRRAVVEKYNWENEGKKLLALYEKLLASD